ncbi:unnamed protein product [Blepharisma stoltei]|uniref:Uncharacterized protein n=1 Tax=Blepharisma stoltei TaxID=1481888 RepID=A0AAU9KR24_9CILI|nr:unnamed protein product [Blepharisma stoltei]
MSKRLNQLWEGKIEKHKRNWYKFADEIKYASFQKHKKLSALIFNGKQKFFSLYSRTLKKHFLPLFYSRDTWFFFCFHIISFKIYITHKLT